MQNYAPLNFVPIFGPTNALLVIDTYVYFLQFIFHCQAKEN